MTDDSVRNDPIADVINLLAAPIAGGIRTMEQYRRSVDEMFRAVDNLNTTLETLNETAQRVNGLLADVEDPIRAMMPQLTRSIETTDQITQILEGPLRAAAPNIERMASTFGSQGFAELPGQVEGFMKAMGDISRGLGPLTNFAENAGGLFGGLRIPGMPSRSDDTPDVAADEQPVTKPSTSRKAAPKKATAKKSSAKKPAAKKTPSKKIVAKARSTKK